MQKNDDGVWVLELEEKVKEQLSSHKKEEKAQRDAPKLLKKRLKTEATRRKREVKAFRKSVKKMVPAQRTAAIAAYKKVLADKREKLKNRVPSDPAVRQKIVQMLQKEGKKLAKEREGHLVEYEVANYQNIANRAQVGAGKYNDRYHVHMEKEGKHKKRLTKINKAYKDNISKVNALLAFARNADQLARRARYEYAVLSKVSWVAEAVEKEGGKLGPAPGFSTMVSLAKRLLETGEKKVALLHRSVPFTGIGDYYVPKRVETVSQLDWKNVGKLDGTYADLSPEGNPVAYLSARGLVRDGEAWSLRAEEQVKRDIDHAQFYDAELTRLMGKFSKSQRDTAVDGLEKLGASQKLIDKELAALAKANASGFGMFSVYSKMREQRHAEYPLRSILERIGDVDASIADLKGEQVEYPGGRA